MTEVETWLDCKKNNVELSCLKRFERLPSSTERNEFDGCAKALAKFAGEIRGDSSRRIGDRWSMLETFVRVR